ncbi:MAG: T9SS type A sorting domain-containing protein [Candidatus Marinimicrobia bacterium]|nr:T9SS type A sorting domain-containing protein [Candidatus Neomarinimicrobiota bacterium]
MMNFDRNLHFQFHYADSMLNQQRLDENSIQLLYLDDNFIWQPITDYDIDTDANLLIVNSRTVAEYYVLKVNSSTVGVDQIPGQLLPQTVEIETAFPNPFNPTATITYSLNETGSVAIQVFDLQGKLIISNQTLKSAGKHNFEWNAQNNFGQSVASGTYLIKVSSGNSNAIRMITLIR